MENYSDSDFEKEIARLELENEIYSLELVTEANEQIGRLVQTYKLEHFARIKLKQLARISRSEMRIYAVLNNVSIKKAAAIVKQFNSLISVLKRKQQASRNNEIFNY